MKKTPKKSSDTHEVPSSASEKSREQKQKSPIISRKIPEFTKPLSWLGLATVKAHWEVVFVSFVSGVLLMGIAVMGFRLDDQYKLLQRNQAEREQLIAKREYWKGIVEKYPDYKDAYYQLAVFSYELGNVADARDAIMTALRIDPNDTSGEELLRRIKG